MLALVTILDGASALLFHVEHASGCAPWQYRVRWPDSSAPALREWQSPRTVEGDGAFVALADRVSRLEAEWCPGDGGEWQAAVPHEFGAASASFAIEVLADRDFTHDPVLRVIGLVRGQPACFDIEMPRAAVAAGSRHERAGVAVNRGPGCVFREAGEFAVENAAFRVVNTGPSQGALQESSLPAVPGVNPYRGAFFVRAGRLPAAEIERILEYARNRRGTVDHGV